MSGDKSGTMSVMIRPATVDDHAGITRIAAELARMHAWALPNRYRESDDPMPVEYLRSLLASDEVLVLVAEGDGKVVGYEVLRLQDTPPIEFVMPRRFVLVSDLAVSEAWRGRGVGPLLIDAAIGWARDRGVSEIELGVFEFNESAIGFYEHLGFRTVKRTMAMSIDRT